LPNPPKRKLAQKGNRKLSEKTFLLLSSSTNINKINFTCFPGGSEDFSEGGGKSCSSYYFDYVYSSHEIQMPVSCALHLINPCRQVKARNDFHGIFVCSCKFSSLCVISQVKKQEIRQLFTTSFAYGYFAGVGFIIPHYLFIFRFYEVR